MKTFLKILLWFFSSMAFLGLCTAGIFWYLWSSNLPYIGSLREYRPPIVTEILSEDGEVIGRFWDEKRFLVPLEDLPENLVHAFVAAEDSRFYEHEGLDFQGIIRAFIKNLEAGKIEQGGSTITQQVTKSLLLKNTKKTYRRKVREAILSMQIERNFSKERILFLYLNQIYLGQGAYGVEAAARTYFGKSSKDLDLAESAVLAGLPQAPSRYSPLQHFEKAKSRQHYVLKRMLEAGYITDQQMREALEEPLSLMKEQEDTFKKAPFFSEHIRKYLLGKYGRDVLYRGGLKVYTTLNLKMQTAARDALNKGLMELDRREGYRGPLRQLKSDEEIASFLEKTEIQRAEKPLSTGTQVEALVEKVDDEHAETIIRIGRLKCLLPLSFMKWARKPNPKVPYYAVTVKIPSRVLHAGDVILVRLERPGDPPYAWVVSLAQEPEGQSGLICMDPATGRIKSLLGGRDFYISQFNRAIQSRRQPGSAFKPLIYAAALDKGMNPAQLILDAPYIGVNAGPDEEDWKPKNYKEKFFGPTLFRTALAKSRNVITVKILKKIGVYYAIQYAHKMGIESKLSPDLSLALGSSGVSLMELTRAYAAFANEGMLITPQFIDKIVDRNGQNIEENEPQPRRVISPETAYIMTDLLQAVIQEGTGWRVKALKRPAAGKTGTTNDLRDAWFMGYTPKLVTGVWVGYDDRRSMGKGETGSRAASPIWLSFMSQVLKDRPVNDFVVPDGIVFAKIDAKTGLLASPYSKETLFQAFKDGTQPTTYTPKPSSPKSGQFLQFDMDFGQ
ncbi:MAG: PBP1A family penicillin-binding protein [Desulfatiglandaceae bacterium]